MSTLDAGSPVCEPQLLTNANQFVLPSADKCRRWVAHSVPLTTYGISLAISESVARLGVTAATTIRFIAELVTH